MGVLSRDAGFSVLTGAAGIGYNSLHLHFLKHRMKLKWQNFLEKL